MEFLDIPSKLLLSIADVLSPRDLTRLSFACRKLSSLLTPPLHNRLAENSSVSPLEWAANYGHVPLTELAISRGARADSKSKLGDHQTPLHCAAVFDHPAIIRILVKHGADVNAEDGHFQTPLGLAVEFSGVEVIRLLLELGADMMHDNPRERRGPAYIRASRRSVGCIKAFIDAGFDINSRGRDGETILHCAASSSPEILEYLLGQQGAKDIINARNSSDKSTPLHWAAGSLSGVESIKLLVRHGADMGILDSYGRTPAHRAAHSRSVENVRAFIDAGFDINTRGGFGQTILHDAIYYHETVLEYLLKQEGAGALVNAQDSKGSTPLHFTAGRSDRRREVVLLLLGHGADPEIKNNNGDTPTQISARGWYFAWWIKVMESAGLTVEKS